LCYIACQGKFPLPVIPGQGRPAVQLGVPPRVAPRPANIPSTLSFSYTVIADRPPLDWQRLLTADALLPCDPLGEEPSFGCQPSRMMPPASPPLVGFRRAVGAQTQTYPPGPPLFEQFKEARAMFDAMPTAFQRLALTTPPMATFHL